MRKILFSFLSAWLVTECTVITAYNVAALNASLGFAARKHSSFLLAVLNNS
jgi:hypothetical protein